MTHSLETLSLTQLATVDGGSVSTALRRGAFEGSVGMQAGYLNGRFVGAYHGALLGEVGATVGAGIGGVVGGAAGAVDGFVRGVGSDIRDSWQRRR